MSRWTPCKRREFIRRLRALEFEGRRALPPAHAQDGETAVRRILGVLALGRKHGADAI